MEHRLRLKTLRAAASTPQKSTTEYTEHTERRIFRVLSVFRGNKSTPLQGALSYLQK